MKAEVRRRPAVSDRALRQRAHVDRRCPTGAASTRRAPSATRGYTNQRLHATRSFAATPARRHAAPIADDAVQAARGHAHARASSTTRTSAAFPTSSCTRPGKPRQPAEGHAVGRRLGEDPRQRSARLRLLGHRPAHDRVVPAARRPAGADARPRDGNPTRSRAASGPRTRAPTTILDVDREYACIFPLPSRATARTATIRSSHSAATARTSTASPASSSPSLRSDDADASGRREGVPDDPRALLAKPWATRASSRACARST